MVRRGGDGPDRSGHRFRPRSAFTGSTSNFSAATSFWASYTPTWMAGLEHGAIYTASSSGKFESKGTTGGSAATGDNAITRSGNYSLKLVKANGGDGYLRAPSLGVQNVVVARLAVRFQTLPSSSPPFFLIQATAGAAATLTYSSSTHKLDAAVGGTGDPFNGQIDYVAIYTTALDQTRIQAHYDAGKP